jgi:hypothetical protein
VRQVLGADVLVSSEAVAVREHRDAVLDVQCLRGQPGEVIERDVEQADVGPPVMEVVGAVGAAAEQDVDWHGRGKGGVGSEDPG